MSGSSFAWQTTLTCEGTLYSSYLPISDHSLKPFLKGLATGPANWKCLAFDHSIWRSSIDAGAAVFEDNRFSKAIEKRAKRNAWASASSAAGCPDACVSVSILRPELQDTNWLNHLILALISGKGFHDIMVIIEHGGRILHLIVRCTLKLVYH